VIRAIRRWGFVCGIAPVALACALFQEDPRVPGAIVPAGWFIAGSDEIERDFARRLGLHDASVLDHEEPRQWASTGLYQIDYTPVTREMWAAFRADSDGSARELGGESALPAVGMPYDAALAYCRWRGERERRPLTLPSGHMWERASRGDDGRIFPWGNSWDPSRTQSRGGMNFGRAPVWYHRSGASPYELLDTCGNVSEWVLSEPGETAWTRGCSYEDAAGHCRAAARRPRVRDVGLATVGFRCSTPEISPPPETGPPAPRLDRSPLARLGCALLRWLTLGHRRCSDTPVSH
jgi:formylglycine-generating enzyme required for sulfatase activity